MPAKRPAKKPHGWIPHPQWPGPKPKEIDPFTNLPKEDIATKEEDYRMAIFINTIGALVFGVLLGMIAMLNFTSAEIYNLRSELLRAKLVNQGLLQQEIEKND